MENKPTSHFIFGLIIGVVVVTIGFVFQMMEIYEPWTQWLVLGLYFASIIVVCSIHSKQLHGTANFHNIFSYGFKTAAIVTLINILSFTITYFLFPEIKTRALNAARAEMAKDERLTEDMINQAMSITDKFYFVFGILGSIFFFAAIGVIAALIGAAVAPKKPYNPFANN